MCARHSLLTIALVLAGLAGACGGPAPHVQPAPLANPPAPLASPPAPLPAPPPAPPAPPPPGGEAVLAWPVAPFTPSQRAEVIGCDTTTLGAARYAKDLAVDALAGAFATHGACDDATLAAACVARLKDGGAALPASCLDAYRRAIKANPAFAFASDLTGGYFGKVGIVAAPPITAHALASVVIVYKWDGLGTGVEWTLTARDLAGKPTISVTGANGKPGATWSAELGTGVAALGHACASFLPVPRPLQAVACTDNYPDWTATLTFDDGSKLELTTQGSNLLGMGGPWQLTVGGATYVQLAPDFIRAVGAIVKTLDLPLGEPEGSMCHGYDLQAAALAP